MSYSVTAYLPGPKIILKNYDLKNRGTPATYHLDECLKRADKQCIKLDNLNRTCLDNIDTCKMYYQSAR
jgi:hypothetical protein